jgi:hypothetical protein
MTTALFVSQIKNKRTQTNKSLMKSLFPALPRAPRLSQLFKHNGFAKFAQGNVAHSRNTLLSRKPVVLRGFEPRFLLTFIVAWDIMKHHKLLWASYCLKTWGDGGPTPARHKLNIPTRDLR